MTEGLTSRNVLCRKAPRKQNLTGCRTRIPIQFFWHGSSSLIYLALPGNAARFRPSGDRLCDQLEASH